MVAAVTHSNAQQMRHAGFRSIVGHLATIYAWVVSTLADVPVKGCARLNDGTVLCAMHAHAYLVCNWKRHNSSMYNIVSAHTCACVIRTLHWTWATLALHKDRRRPLHTLAARTSCGHVSASVPVSPESHVASLLQQTHTDICHTITVNTPFL